MQILPLFKTNKEAVDITILSVIKLCEQAFPKLELSYYLTGSFADNTAIASSDIDMTVLANDSLSNIELTSVAEFLDSLSEICAIPLDIHCVSLSAMSDLTRVLLKQGSQPLYGPDLRDRIVLPPIHEVAAYTTANARKWTAIVRGKSELPDALDFPDPEQEYFGYIELIDAPDRGPKIESTKLLVVLVGWIACALVARAGHYAASKHQCAELYREVIGDEWSDLVDATYTKVREEWNYHIPENKKARDELRALCIRTLDFERYFLSLS